MMMLYLAKAVTCGLHNLPSDPYFLPDISKGRHMARIFTIRSQSTRGYSFKTETRPNRSTPRPHPCCSLALTHLYAAFIQLLGLLPILYSRYCCYTFQPTQNYHVLAARLLYWSWETEISRSTETVLSADMGGTVILFVSSAKLWMQLCSPVHFL